MKEVSANLATLQVEHDTLLQEHAELQQQFEKSQFEYAELYATSEALRAEAETKASKELQDIQAQLDETLQVILLHSLKVTAYRN